MSNFQFESVVTFAEDSFQYIKGQDQDQRRRTSTLNSFVCTSEYSTQYLSIAEQNGEISTPSQTEERKKVKKRHNGNI